MPIRLRRLLGRLLVVFTLLLTGPQEFSFGDGIAPVRTDSPTTGESTAREKTPQSVRDLLEPVLPAKVFTVAPGQSKTFKLTSPIEGVDLPNRTVCSVSIVRDGIVLTGLKFGKTHFTVWGKESGISTFEVHVIPDRGTVLAELLAKYRESQLQLIPSPESGKVIIKGTLPSSGAVHDVLEHIEGPDLPRSQLINRMAIPCGNCSCCPHPRRIFNCR